MEKNKGKKKTLTISGSFTRKISPGSFNKPEKKTYSIQKKKIMRQDNKQKSCQNNLVRHTENIFKVKTKRLLLTWQKNLR